MATFRDETRLRFALFGCTIMETQIHYSPEELMSQAPMMESTSDDRLWAALAYVFSPLVPIIIMLMADKKDRPFIKAHNTQALVLGIVTLITSTFCIGILVWFYQLYCAYQAYQGQLVEIPLISGMFKS
jgi:uncharacterized membrane protein